MENQTLTPPGYDPSNFPVSSSLKGIGGPGGGGGGGTSPLLVIVFIILALAALVFGVLTLTFASKASSATKNLEAKTTAAATAARADQKKTDDENYTTASNSPYRSYTAPEQFGSFVINFPKMWSSTVDQEASGTQVNLVLNPDFIRRTNGYDANMAMRITLQERTKDQFMAPFANLIKTGKIKKADIKVSDQPAIDLTGTFSDKKTVHQVVVPVRDKIIVFSSEDKAYGAEFGQILAQAKIIP